MKPYQLFVFSLFLSSIFSNSTHAMFSYKIVKATEVWRPRLIQFYEQVLRNDITTLSITKEDINIAIEAKRRMRYLQSGGVLQIAHHGEEIIGTISAAKVAPSMLNQAVLTILASEELEIDVVAKSLISSLLESSKTKNIQKIDTDFISRDAASFFRLHDFQEEKHEQRRYLGYNWYGTPKLYNEEVVQLSWINKQFKKNK